MCRHLAWLGQPRSVASLVTEPPHGLLVQSYAPRRQTRVTMNADGWGVGFLPPDGPSPVRWRSTRPMWTDASFASLAPALRSGCILAAIRAATTGMPIEESATAPFLVNGWLISLNGQVDRSLLPVGLSAESMCDAALLAAHLGELGPDQLATVVPALGTQDPTARLNLLVTDGRRLLATTWGDTLSVLETDDGVVVASEPFDDDPRWLDVPDRHLVTAGPDAAVTITALEESS